MLQDAGHINLLSVATAGTPPGAVAPFQILRALQSDTRLRLKKTRGRRQHLALEFGGVLKNLIGLPTRAGISQVNLQVGGGGKKPRCF